MICLIDADALVYIIAWNHKDSDEIGVKLSCDTFLSDILLLTGCDQYIGVFSDKVSFRNEWYRYAPYKGQRKDKEQWLLDWESVIKNYYINKHGFVTATDLEADDICVAGSVYFTAAGVDTVIASPDKDLRQVPGKFYNFSKKTVEDAPVVIELVTDEQANYNLWLSIITGDMTDNVYGVPGLGPVKAKKLLDEAIDPLQYLSIARGAYAKYFGPHYGRIIFDETRITIMMMQPGHTLWPGYKADVIGLLESSIRNKQASAGMFDV